ncbi:MAG TPA: hypothetical protein VFB28_00030 [Terriglobales bacterium]|nr:hypothetical protein [Terriglobales bacterium]
MPFLTSKLNRRSLSRNCSYDLALIANVATPVLLLGAVEHGPLGILRSLGRLRVPVYVCESDRWSPALFSRYCREAFPIPLGDCADHELVRKFERVAQRIGQRAILLPTTDAMSVFVAEHADELRQWFLLPEQNAGLVRSMACKHAMHGLAKRHGLATAESYFPLSRADVMNFAARAVYPVLLKAITAMDLWHGLYKRVFIAHNAAELMQRYDSIPDSQRWNVMLQEYIPGGDDAVWMFNGYFNRDSECLAGYTGRKLRQCPVYCGVASLGVCETNQEVADESKRFLRSAGYCGPVDIDYKRDPRDGQYKVLDVNPRIGASFRVCVSDNGMDVVRALYLDLTGQKVVPGRPLEGRKWLVEDLDSVSCIRYSRNGILMRHNWLQSYRGVEETAYFAADDPMPLLPMCVIDSRKAASRIAQRVRGGLQSVRRTRKVQDGIGRRHLPRTFPE